ncbi:Extradiol ring-cleavage dioxygenase, class III enzyme, subunit B [Gorgonomyces haynaldii]|nr:Extradiol ring-cleavage dioxygenase, class III enzyme, subunit B [Gorgonomyces haynaldii]
MVAPSIFVPHGGGPMPVLGHPSHTDLIQFMKTKARSWLGNPKAVVLVTAHWETDQVAISSADKHPLLYDYYNFPPEAYKITYQAPGSSSVAQKVRDLLQKSGIESSFDSKRGWDHGVFIPLKLMAPEESIPVVQVSVLANQNPKQLAEYGRALAPLLQEDIAIVGSGMSFHNMPRFFDGNVTGNKEFEQKLLQVAKLPVEERLKELEQWRSWPGAYDCHPKGAAEHFSPFIVAAAAGSKFSDAKSVKSFAADVSGYLWQ